MKSNWSRFWNFVIQFFVVVLGVFITLWVGNLTEKSKENQRTGQALRMIRQELANYQRSIERKIPLLEEEANAYRQIIRYTTTGKLPAPDSLISYIETFRLYTLENVIHISLESAEKSGALYNIKDLSLLEYIYDSYEYVSLIYRLNNEKNNQKLQKIIANTTPTNTDVLLLGGEDIIDHDIAVRVWKEITSNPDLFTAVINGSMQSSLIDYAADSGLERIRMTIGLIDEYLR